MKSNSQHEPSRFNWKILDNAPPILDRQHILQAFNISIRTLQRWRDEKILAFVKIKGKIFYNREVVIKLMEDMERK